MGFFGKKKAKKEAKKEAAATPVKKKTPTTPKQATATPPPNDKDTPKEPVVVPDEPTLDQIPAYCDEIKAGKEPARALRMLFTLSEHKSQNRLAMVQQGKLVPTLLDFLCDCEKGSSEQYLALLVLNNISIPTENKRVSDYLSLLLLRVMCCRCDCIEASSLTRTFYFSCSQFVDDCPARWRLQDICSFAVRRSLISLDGHHSSESNLL